MTIHQVTILTSSLVKACTSSWPSDLQCNTDADHSIIHFIFKPELHRQNDTFTVVAKNKPADLEM